jgi:hypothetical protein
MVMGGSGDGVHPGATCADKWASDVVAQVNGEAPSGALTTGGTSKILIAAGIFAAALMVLLFVNRRRK